MRIECEVEYGSETNDYGTDSSSVYATCPNCGHTTMSWGDSDASIKRCLVLLNQECDCPGNNLFVEAP